MIDPSRVFILPAEHPLTRESIPCPICSGGFAVNDEVVLMPVPETREGWNVQADPVHLKCLKRAITAFERWELTR